MTWLTLIIKSGIALVLFSSTCIDSFDLRRPAWEHHPWPYTDTGYGSQNAVDGDYSDRFAAGGQCSISADNNYTEATWGVDLGVLVSINHVDIFYRTNNEKRPPTNTSQIAGFILYVPNTTSKDDGYLCFHDIENVACALSENKRICNLFYEGEIDLYYVYWLEDVYPSFFSKFAYSELCKDEIYDILSRKKTQKMNGCTVMALLLIGPPTYTSRIAWLILYVPNTTSKGDGHLCFHEIQNVACTPPENQRIYSPSNASYFIYYNVHMLEVIYQSYYSECADSELCKVELYGCRKPRYFGKLMCKANCQEKRCNINTGYCLSCLPGYKDQSCKHKKPSDDDYKNIVIVLCAPVILTVVFCLIFAIRYDNLKPIIKKLRIRHKSPPNNAKVKPIIKATKITYDYGPRELNLFKYVAEETHFLWEKAKGKNNNDNEPSNGIVLIHDDDTEIEERCLQFLDFDIPSEKLERDCLLKEQPEVICVLLLRETFWKATNIAFEEVLNNVVKKVPKVNVFFMVSNEDLHKAYEFCKRFNICPPSNVISPDGNKKVFYDSFYDILEKQMATFLKELQTRTVNRDVLIEEELESLIKKLHSRNITTKPKLTKQCLARIKKASEYGVVGYRLFENELYIFENGPLMMEAEKKMQLKSYIKDSFKGKVKITPLSKILKPHCAIKCGGYITNDISNKSGTLGVFGKMRDFVHNNQEKTVALSSPNLFIEGDFASLPNGDNIGVCVWPVKPEPPVENICDVSIIEIDSSRINTLERTIFKKQIIVEEIPYNDLDYRLVFKYGAKTQTTYGWITKISNFQLFENEVLVILPKSPAISFSEEGDSGAIVVTKIKGNHLGVGMVYGSDFDVENTSNNNAKNATIGIFLKNALDRFTARRSMSIQFDEI